MTRPGTPLVLACIFLLLLHICHAETDNDGPLPETDDYPYHAQLDENYTLQWRLNSTHIMFHTRVKATGYVGFGVSRNGDMAPGDVVIGWMDGDGATHFHDRHAKTRAMPEIDQQQDWKLIGLKKDDGQYINMTFIRKLNTCDEEEDIPIEAATTRVIYAYSDAVPVSDDVIPYHGAQTRGTRSLLLLNPPPMESDATNLPDDVITVDFLLNDYSVPADDTTYACKIFKLPELSGKHHMIRYEPVIQAGHEKLLHHTQLNTCVGNISEELVDSVYECYTPQEPEELRNLACVRLLMVWAVGGSAFDYPHHVGHSMGAPDDPVYFRLQTHYDNPALKSDYVDTSGFRMYLTKQLRQHDAGMLMVGTRTLRHRTIIPPGVPDFLARGYATPACLDKAVGDGEIRVFSDMLHSHLLGRRLATRHIRNGQELPPITKDDYYDFNYQERRLLPEERIIKKGDLLIQDCHFDSSERTEVTYSGLSTREEMCFSFLLYYPTTQLKSIWSTTALMYTKNGEPMYPEGVYNFSINANWSDQQTLDTFVHNVHTSDVQDLCVTSNSEGVIPSTQPKVFQEYQPEDVCDLKGDGRLSATSLPLLMIFCAAIASFYTMMV